MTNDERYHVLFKAWTMEINKIAHQHVAGVCPADDPLARAARRDAFLSHVAISLALDSYDDPIDPQGATLMASELLHAGRNAMHRRVRELLRPVGPVAATSN